MAKDYYQGVTVVYEGDTTKLSAALADLNKDLRQSQSAARALDSALKLDDSNFDALKLRAAETEKQIKSTEERIKYLKEAMGNASDPDVLVKLNEQAAIAESRLTNLKEQYASLNTNIDMESGIGSAVKGLGDFGDTAQQIGNDISDMGDKLTVGLTVPIVAMATATVDAAVTIDDALTGVRKTVDGTEEDYQALKEAAIEYSKTNAVSAEEVLNVQALGAQLGYSIDQLEMLGRVGSGMDIATDMGAEQAVTDMAQFANITGMAKEESENYASTIVALGNNTATTESKISDMAQRIAAAGSQVGMSESEILGLAASLSSVGMEAEAGGTAISTIISQIDKDVATGSDSLTTWASTAGMSAEEFSAAWKSSPTEALTALLSNLDAAADAGGNMSVMLENLGVNSIRQTDALKRLAGNSSLVTESVNLANQAWRENTALSEEVANKNDSLSAKIEMLQNRVTAILEKIGKPLADAALSILDAAEPLFELIENGAQAFADMDEETQKLIVTALAVAAALGPVMSIGGRILSGIGGAASTISGVAESVMLFSNSLAAGLPAAEAATGAFGSMGTAAAGLAAALPVIAAVIGGAEIIGSLHSMYEETQLVESATRSVSEIADEAASSVQGYSDAVDGASTSSASISEIIDMANDSLKEASEHLDGVSESLGELETSKAAVDEYAETMKELSGAGELTEEQQAQLAVAVEGYNEATGAAVSITDALHGTLNLLPGEIDEVTAAYKRQAEQQAYQELYTEAIKEQARQQQELKKTYQELADSSNTATLAFDMLSKSLDPVGAAQNLEKVSNLRASINGLEEGVQNAAEEVEYFGGLIDASAATFSTLEGAMTSAGVTSEQYASLTEEQLAEIAASFDGTIDSIASKLSSFGITVKNVGDTAVDGAKTTASTIPTIVEQGVDDAAEAAKTAQQRANDEIYTAQQRAYDAIYREEQRALDALYTARQRELDAEYTAQQRAYDDEYSARQAAYDDEYELLRKQLESEYSLRQKELTAIEDATRKSNEKLLANLKSANDKQESELKSALDKKYKQIKAELDSEIAAQKKANSDALKSLKETQSAATKAYKAATTARIKEMQREYEASVAYLEQNNGTSEIDARIAELKAETEAEKRAATEQQQNEKVADLQRAVEQAKSRRKRAEAEKALNDYLAEIAQKAREQERSDEIARLEDQKDIIKQETDAKKDALKEQYDAEKEAYETQREEQLAREDKQREEDYERLSETLAKELEARQAAADSRLEKEKASNEAQLEQMRSLHDEQETAYKEMLENELTALREAHATELETRKEQNSETLENLKDSQSEQLELLKNSQSDQLQSLKDSHADQLTELKNANSDQLQALKDSQADALTALKNSLSDQLDVMTSGGATIAEAAGDAAEQSTENMREGFSQMPAETGAVAKQTLQQYLNNINDLPWSTKNIADTTGHNLVERLNAYVMPTTNASKALRNSALRDIEGLPSSGSQIGGSFGSNLASSIGNKSSEVGQSASNLRVSALDPLNQLNSGATSAGQQGGSGFASGLRSGGSGAKGEAESIANSVMSSLSSAGNNSYSWGYDAGYNFFDGLRDIAPSIWDQARNIAQGVADYLAHTKPKLGAMRDDDEWGGHLVMNLVDDMAAHEPYLVREAQRISRLVEDNFSPELSARYDANLNYATSGGYGSAGFAASGEPPQVYVTLNLGDVTLGSGMDIRATARDLATETARELAAALK